MPKTNPELNFIRALKKLSLSESRRFRMREELMAFADLHAVRPHTKKKREARPAPGFGYASITMRLWYGVTAFVLIFMVAGGGAAFAAEDTVPGDALYPLKVSVEEPVQGALISTPEGKAEWHSVLAERRLEEATTLATENKLTPATQQYLAQQFTQNVNTAGAVADALDASGNANASLTIHSDLEARLTANADILGLVANHLETASSTEESATQTRALLALVSQKRESTTLARLALEDQTSVTATSSAASLAIATEDTGTVEAQLKGDAANGDAVPAAAHDVADAQSDVTSAEGDISVNPTAAYHQADDATRASQVASILLEHASLLKSIGVSTTTLEDITSVSSTSSSTPDAGNIASTTSSTPAMQESTSTEMGKRKSFLIRLEGK